MASHLPAFNSLDTTLLYRRWCAIASQPATIAQHSLVLTAIYPINFPDQPHIKNFRDHEHRYLLLSSLAENDPKVVHPAATGETCCFVSL